jgi:hypothetical protein
LEIERSSILALDAVSFIAFSLFKLSNWFVSYSVSSAFLGITDKELECVGTFVGDGYKLCTAYRFRDALFTQFAAELILIFSFRCDLDTCWDPCVFGFLAGGIVFLACFDRSSFFLELRFYWLNERSSLSMAFEMQVA